LQPVERAAKGINLLDPPGERVSSSRRNVKSKDATVCAKYVESIDDGVIWHLLEKRVRELTVAYSPSIAED